MDMNIRINHYQVKDMLAYASVTFDDIFRLDNVRIMRAQNSGIKIVLPEYVKNGERHEIFHPMNSYAREQFDSAVLTAFSNALDGQNVTKITDKNLNDFTVTRVNSNMYEKNNVIGLANVSFANAFVIEGVRIKEGQNGAYIEMPQSKHTVTENGRIVYNIDGTAQVSYKPIFIPMTSDAYNHLYNAVMQNFNVQQLMYENAVAVNVEDIGEIRKLPSLLLNEFTTEDLIAGKIGDGVTFDSQKQMFSMSSAQFNSIKKVIVGENYAYVNAERKKAQEQNAEKSASSAKKSVKKNINQKQQKAVQNQQLQPSKTKNREQSKDAGVR